MGELLSGRETHLLSTDTRVVGRCVVRYLQPLPTEGPSFFTPLPEDPVILA